MTTATQKTNPPPSRPPRKPIAMQVLTIFVCMLITLTFCGMVFFEILFDGASSPTDYKVAVTGMVGMILQHLIGSSLGSKDKQELFKNMTLGVRPSNDQPQ